MITTDPLHGTMKLEPSDEVLKEIYRLRAENEKLRAALKPFAELGATLAPAPEDDPPWINWEISHTDLRAARAAMEK